MMNKLLKQTLVCTGTLLLSMQVVAKPSSEAKEVRGIIDKVNTYWQTHNKPEVRSFWDNAAYHTGNMEAYFLTGNENYRAYSETWAIHNEWKGAKVWNMKNINRILGGDQEGKVSKLLAWSGDGRDIADPWYTGNFDETYDDVLEGCEAFLTFLLENGLLY